MKSSSDSADDRTNAELHSLVARLRARLPSAEVDLVEQLIYVGEPVVAWEQIAGALGDGRATISRKIYDDLQELGRSLGADFSFLEGVVVEPGTAQDIPPGGGG